MSTDQKELSNQDITLRVSEEPGCLVSLNISVSPGAVSKSYKKALKTINKQVSLPGFRKGKIPNELLIKNFEPSIDREWRDNVTQDAIEASMKLAELVPLNQEALRHLKLDSCSQEEGAEVSAKLETMPVVPTIEVETLKLKQTEAEEVTDEVLQSAINDLREIYTSFEEVTDRSAKEGDAVTITVEQTNEPQRQLCEDARFEIKEGKMAAWMRKLLIERSVGDVVEGSSEWEEDSGVAEDKFVKTDVKISISKIEQAAPPEDDAALATKMNLESVEQLHERIRDDLKQRYEREAKDELRKQLHDQILERYPFELPLSLVEAERQSRIRNKIKGLKRQNASRDVIIGLEKEIEGLVAQEVDQSLRIFFLLRKLADDAKIQISREEIVQLFNYQMLMVPEESRIIEESMKPEEMHDRLMAQLITQKVTDYLMDRVTVE